MKMFAGTSINLELRFDKMSTDANKIVLLQILFEQYPGKVIEFRNVPLKKE